MRKLTLTFLGLIACSFQTNAESYMTGTYFEAQVNQVTSYEYVNFRIGNLLSEHVAIEARGNIGRGEGDFYTENNQDTSYELGIFTKFFTTPLKDDKLGHYIALGYNKNDLQQNVRSWWYQDQLPSGTSTTFATGLEYKLSHHVNFNSEIVHLNEEDVSGINFTFTASFD